MNMRCETVKICDGGDSYVIINKSDFDEEIHKEYTEPKVPEKKDEKKDTKAK